MSETKKLLELYADEKKKFLENFPFKEVEQAVDLVWNAYLNNGTIYACGNGGNAAYVANMITDFSMHPFVSDDKSKSLPIDVKRLRCVNLVESPASLTAILNDLGPEHVFSQQLINYGIKREDVLFGFSGSGNSGNVIEAFKIAEQYQAKTIAITRKEGSKSDMADLVIVTKGNSTFPGQIGGNNFNFHFEDALSSIAHMITGILRKKVEETYRKD